MLKLTAEKKQWFPVPQDEAGETRIQIRHLKPGEVSDIEAKANQVKGKSDGEDFNTEIEYNLSRRAKLFVSKSVVDWEGFVGLKDKALPCTEANKMKVLKEFDWFAAFIEDCRAEMAEDLAEKAEEVEKN